MKLKDGQNNSLFVEPVIYKRRPLEYKIDDSGCFICTSHASNGNKYNHIRFKMNNKNVLAHRFVYQECFGEIPDGLVVRHKCDKPKCINPEHLELGTDGDNVRDMVSRGRQARGEKNGNSILKESDIREIRFLLSKGYSCVEIGKMYKTAAPNISNIKNRKRWRHV